MILRCADGRLLIQCAACSHFSLTENEKWVCRNCSGSMIGFVTTQARTKKVARSVWKAFK